MVVVVVAGAYIEIKSSQVANPHNAFCIEQRTAAKPKEAQVRVFGLFLPLPRLSPVRFLTSANAKYKSKSKRRARIRKHANALQILHANPPPWPPVGFT